MLHPAGPYRFWILAFLLIIITAEIIWSWKNDKKAYEVKETFSNLAVLAGFQFSKLLFAGYQLAALGFFLRVGAIPFAAHALGIPHHVYYG